MIKKFIASVLLSRITKLIIDIYRLCREDSATHVNQPFLVILKQPDHFLILLRFFCSATYTNSHPSKI